MNNEEYIIV